MPFHEDFEQRYDYLTFGLERAAMHLISLLVADRELQRSYREYGLALQDYAEEHKENELLRLTVEIATSYRLMRWNSKNPIDPGHVGILCEDHGKDEWVDLSMLEACNKIIHADALVFERQKFRGLKQYYLKPSLAVTGRKGKKEWTAIIEMLFFCSAAVEPLENPFAAGKNERPGG